MAKTKGSSVNKTRTFGGVTVKIDLWRPTFRVTPADGLAGMKPADRDRLIEWAWGEWNGFDSLHPTATPNTVRAIFFGVAK